MSSALAIAAVTASIKDLLNDGFMDQDLSTIGSFSITAQPPDRVTTGTTEANQLNLFLYQVTPNSGWRNVDLPSRGNTGARLTNAPLALDLHYLLSAYGAQDMNAEILLGYAMQLLHETPVLTRQQLRIALGSPSPPVDGSLLPGPFGTLSAVDLADQIELIKITPMFLTSEELSKLWTAMQARYRPSMAYMASVVLIQNTASTRRAPPVLKRGPDDRGPVSQAVPPPVLAAVRVATSPLLPAARLGDDLFLTGTHLARPGTVTARFTNTRLGISHELPLTAVSATQATAHLPTIAENPAGMDEWSAGVYTVALCIAQPGAPTWSTNGVPLALSPRITVSPLNAVPGLVEIEVVCEPRLNEAQVASVRLMLGEREIQATSITTPADTSQPTTLHFSVADVAAGSYPARLRVDGIDTLPVTVTGSPAIFDFDPQQTLVVA